MNLLLDYLDKGEIPPMVSIERNLINNHAWEIRDQANSRGMWAVVDKTWTKDLADWIGDHKVLEVMCGFGWLAKALKDHSVDIVATDNQSWDGNRHSIGKPFSFVENLDGLSAVKKYKDADVLLVSWPPYQGKEICRICEAWEEEKPIIYIGEMAGGCTACDEFFSNFDIGNYYDDGPYFYMPQWDGMNDEVVIGYYKKGVKNDYKS